ncbi:sigma 54-interacting transcriptional regulator [Aneurinibacillus sp. Ricciae_BoGa-3]|uniref:sigma-54 interaction domain-containing protein n=1 Tax=Aneurinibacillus sp. Ricciae_BoGa-3 TaxID=3022697 RepID=UPI00234095F3|nr:sigma 54-interacting transcriptional regulator [Aneurinibacillus sp. Ricciae_BoGa-3]WCK52751.1 sigma 54-interacting transcriptional regulator [Aneurinibacillus sp. Ricciae_BoGa-3]
MIPYPFYNPALKKLAIPLDSKKMSDQTIRADASVHLVDLFAAGDLLFDQVLVTEGGQVTGYVTREVVMRALFQSLRESHAFYECLLDTVDDSITIVNESGEVIGWNRQAVKMYDIAPGDIIGGHITRHFKQEAVMLLRSIEDCSSVSGYYNQPRESSHVLVNTSPVVLDGRIIGSMSAEKDISDVVRLNEKLTTTHAYLQDLEKEFYSDQLTQPFHKIKGHSPAIMKAVHLSQKVAATEATVLIQGESGVGKELFAEAIHKASHRGDQPFVALNCGAIPAPLFESELFGYKKGAFTGAINEGKKGKIDMAEGGTLFLDEIGELPLDQQVKLLRVLQERQFYRVGGNDAIPANVRFIAATNRDLEEMVNAGTFRQDLFYRLNVVSIAIPPLRERTEDIAELVHMFMKDFSIKYGKPVPEISPDVVALFNRHPWPGNIRQLRNMVERLVILNDQELIEPHHLPDGFMPAEPASKRTAHFEQKWTEAPPVHASSSECDRLVHALRTTYGNKSAAAQLLGISRATLYNRMKKYQLEP